MKLYDDPRSGNGYKVRLLLAHLGREYEYVPLDVAKSETRTAEFLARNANGKIPLLELDDGRFLPESNAILYFLAQATPYWPADSFEQAEVLQWLCFEQYSHEPNIATVRYWVSIRGTELTPVERELVLQKRENGLRALGVMDAHLASRSFFVGDRYTIADIGLYAYTHVADEGGFDLAKYPAVRRWLDRVRAQPKHVRIDAWPRSPGAR
jgi:glutathione S-transferase